IPVSIHAGFYTDGMTTADDNTLAAAFTNAVPTANIDRIFYPAQPYIAQPLVAIGVTGMGYSTNEWKTAVEARHQIISPVSISASNTYDNVSRLLTVTINATFYGPVTGNFRMNCYVIEDSVTGTGTGYDQHSYYHDAPTTLNPWFGVGTTNLGSSTWAIAGYVHRYVERKLLDGVWGTAGVIPTVTTDGAVYTSTYTYTLPSNYNASHISLVPFVFEYNSNYVSGKNEIQNVLSLPLNSSASIPFAAANVALSVNLPANQIVCNGSQVILNPTVTGGQPPYSFAWQSTGNAPGCQNCQNPSVTL